MKVRRGELVDLYVDGERCVVMVGESVLVLGEVATAIVEAVSEGSVVTVVDVADAVVEIFGEPEPPHTAEELTLQHVHDLVAHGVLELVEEDSGTGGSSLHSSHLSQRAEAVDSLRSALRHIRSDGEAPWPLPVTVTPDDFVATAHRHHVVAFLALHLERLDLPPRARSVLTSDAARLRAGAYVLADELARALDVLDSAGVRALAFKGIALAVQAHGDLAARGAGDLDLLVPPNQLEDAHRALTGAGWSPAPGYPVPGPSWAWRHFARTHNELTLESPTSTIDLHWHLTPTRETFPPFDVLWSRRDLVQVGCRTVPTLALYDALAHSAGHAARDRWRWMRSLMDVHVLASRSATWQQADRPLRPDQHFSLGLTARLLGTPSRSPLVVLEAEAQCTALLSEALAHQASDVTGLPPRPLGQTLRLDWQSLMRTDGSLREAARLMKRTALPLWLSHGELAPHATVAVPRVLVRRLGELGRKLRSRLS